MMADLMDWRNTNLGLTDLEDYLKIYQEASQRNPMAADQTFRATVGRMVNPNETPAIDALLEEIKKRQNAMRVQ
jgi:hypothetical protein